MHNASKVPPLSTGMAPLQSSKHSNRCIRHRRSHHSQLEWLLHNLPNFQTDAQRIKGPTTLNRNGSFTIFQTFKQMHKASKVPPLSTGMAPPQSSKLSNRCTTHQRSHHSQPEWLLYNLPNFQTDAQGIEGPTTLNWNGSSTI